MTDCVFVRGLEFEGNHGYTAAERRGTRRFRVNLTLELPLDRGRRVGPDWRHRRLLEGQRDRRRARHQVDVQADRGARRRDRRRRSRSSIRPRRCRSSSRSSRRPAPACRPRAACASPAGAELAMAAFTYRFPGPLRGRRSRGHRVLPAVLPLLPRRVRGAVARAGRARAYRDLLDHDRVGFPAVRAECDFKAPLRFGDDGRDRAVDRAHGREVDHVPLHRLTQRTTHERCAPTAASSAPSWISPGSSPCPYLRTHRDPGRPRAGLSRRRAAAQRHETPHC